MPIKFSRGGRYTAHGAISASATSDVQDCRTHNSLMLFFDLYSGSGSWTIKIQAKCPVTGNYVDAYDHNGAQMAMINVSESRAQVFLHIPDEFKIVATELEDGATIYVTYDLFTA